MNKMILTTIFSIVSLLINTAGFSADTKSFKIEDGNFVIDGKPIRIISGEIHYPRIPHQYWRHRLKMMKAMGLNTVATCVFWNIHEPQESMWDFEGDKDLATFIKTASEEGLMVILRPGPYVCAEWEFGGYPWWLQNIEGMELRCNNQQFLKYTDIYIKRLYQEIKDLLCTNGGPVIMVQVENEFGSYAAQREDIPMDEHKAYNATIKQQLTDAGFNTPLFTSDGSWLFQGGSIEGALPTANGESSIETLTKRVDEYHNGKGPYMVAEFYPGWLAHWAEPHPRVPATEIARKAEEYLQNGVSFNIFMAHGGTSFGFTSGANYNDEHDIQPDLTSYDYDAPISEAGWVTPKYDSLRNVISKYVKYVIPEPPKAIDVIEIPDITMDKVVNILDMAKRGKAITNDRPMSFEALGQDYGYVLYSRQFNQPIKAKLTIDGLRDFAVVYINGKKIGELNRYYKQYSMDVDIPFNSTLDILVENMGRINYGPEIVRNNKGIISPVKIGEFDIEGGWKMYQLPFPTIPCLSKYRTLPISQAGILSGKPVVYEGRFNLVNTGDTFLDMSRFGKGIVFINGRNIGRYYATAGPQQTLYLPGVWLKEGENTIVVFEQLNDTIIDSLSGIKTPILDYKED